MIFRVEKLPGMKAVIDLLGVSGGREGVTILEYVPFRFLVGLDL